MICSFVCGLTVAFLISLLILAMKKAHEQQDQADEGSAGSGGSVTPPTNPSPDITPQMSPAPEPPTVPGSD